VCQIRTTFFSWATVADARARHDIAVARLTRRLVLGAIGRPSFFVAV
jgi:hypothetical protein